jgi:hypothetical protein
MNKLLGTALMATTLSMTATAAVADEQVRETRPVDAKVTRIKLGGVVDLTVRQGATPSLIISGDRRDVAKVTTSQSGDTLQIDTERHSVNINFRDTKVSAELTVPNLAEFVSQGVGGSRVVNFSGDSIKIVLDGAGSVTVDGRYRDVDAKLGGAGSMTLNGMNAERVALKMGGAGRMAVNGQTKALNAKMSGVGSLDADTLRSDNLELEMSGIGSASVYAKTSAIVRVSGLGSANVYGNPATRKGDSSGMGKIHWK